jgi:hypothetical protein
MRPPIKNHSRMAYVSLSANVVVHGLLIINAILKVMMSYPTSASRTRIPRQG